MNIFGGCFDVDSKLKRLQDIENLEMQPGFWDDNNSATKIQKEKTILLESVNPIKKVKVIISDCTALIELGEELSGLDDDSISELKENISQADAQLIELKMKSILRGKLDESNAYFSIHAGAGGTEACDWCAILARMYKRYCSSKGYQVHEVDFTDGDGAGYRSITFEIIGPYAFGYLKAEMGVHRLVRISPFDANKKRHTSFASVEVFPSVEDEIDIEIRDEDLRIDTYRASGSGGQHVNKTDSAVRMTHSPSGIVVQCQSERSQIQNRARCMKMLKAKLYELEEKKRQEEVDKVNSSKQKNEWGSQIRNYVLQPYRLVKDVRTGFESSNVDKILDGEIHNFIEKYLLLVAEEAVE